jgi:Subunit 11 of the general transcription factor TFIIH
MQSSSTQSDSLGASAEGGFFEPCLPSPAPSSAMMSASATALSTLPSQRARPLKSGSMKETAVISHVDNRFLKINRRHAKKFSSAIGGQDKPEERGYESFKEVVKDLEAIIDIVWVTGTRMLFFASLIVRTKPNRLLIANTRSITSDSISYIVGWADQHLSSGLPLFARSYIPTPEEARYQLRVSYTRRERRDRRPPLGI